MKSISIIKIFKHVFFFSLFANFYSCGYNDIYDTEYPEEQVYITGTYNSIIYKVNTVAEKENMPSRCKIDMENNKLIIPLGIYRASVKSETNVSVQLEIDNDTIPELIESGVLVEDGETAPDILPEGKYELNKDINILKGEELANFNLSIDIPFLLEDLNKRYVLGIKITNSSAKINQKMSLIVVDILSALVEAHPDFTFEINEANPLEVTFTNTSKYCLSYEWNFGDDSPSVTDKEPSKHTFPNLGTYYVALTAKGIRGNTVTTTKRVHLWEDATVDYIKNPGDPFEKAGLVSGRVDVLKDWSYTTNVLSTYNSANDIYIGGYQGDNGGVMDFYANQNTGGALENAKIYQTMTSLPTGPYYAGFIPFGFTGENNCYFVVTKGNTLPDIENVATDTDVIGYINWNKPLEEIKYGVEFDLESAQDITIGFVVSNESGARVKIKSVFLFK